LSERRSRCARELRLLIGLCTAALACISARAQAQNDVAQTTVYVRTDGDHTTIVTPALHVGAQLTEGTRVDLTYTVDVWTSASVDIVTAASEQVTEQRDEVDVALAQTLGDVTLGASYRHSIENDYESNGGSLGASFDFAQKNSTLAVVARALSDRVWAAGGEKLKRPVSMLSARLAFTQVLDRNTLGQLSYEIARQSGYLASPYRYVRIADDAGSLPSTCVTPLDMCVLERTPDERARHAAAIELRRALGSDVSVGAGYRFYLDDWDLSSHTIEADLAFVPAEAWLLDLSYRFYTQNKAGLYRPFYPLDSLPAYYSSDKELSTLTTQRVQLELTKLWDLDNDGTRLRTVLLAAPTLYTYSDFPLLDRIVALELTLSAGVEL
jgi:hypothetical protein